MFFLGPYISNMCDIWFSIMQAHLFVANNNFYGKCTDCTGCKSSFQENIKKQCWPPPVLISVDWWKEWRITSEDDPHPCVVVDDIFLPQPQLRRSHIIPTTPRLEARSFFTEIVYAGNTSFAMALIWPFCFNVQLINSDVIRVILVFCETIKIIHLN